MSETHQYIGKPATRVDALEKVLGTARYVGDYRLPGMVYARALRSPLPHARIVRLDVTPALRIPGVLAAIIGDDFVDHGRFGYPVQDMYMLAYQRVRYVGDAIAAIAAETEEALQAGLNAIVIELEPLPGVFDPVAALQPGTPIVGERPWDAPDMPRGNLLTQYVVRKGEPEVILPTCAVTLDEKYSTMHQEREEEQVGVCAAGSALARWTRPDRLCRVPKSLCQPGQLVPRTGAARRRCPRHSAARGRRFRRQG